MRRQESEKAGGWEPLLSPSSLHALRLRVSARGGFWLRLTVTPRLRVYARTPAYFRSILYSLVNCNRNVIVRHISYIHPNAASKQISGNAERFFRPARSDARKPLPGQEEDRRREPQRTQEDAKRTRRRVLSAPLFSCAFLRFLRRSCLSVAAEGRSKQAGAGKRKKV
jgi:hypothetical protein